MRKFHAYNEDTWPRGKNGEMIFADTNEAIHYANIVREKQVAYNLLKKWRRNAYQNLEFEKTKKPINYDKMFDLAVRAQLYREAMEEIQRINEKEGL